MQTIAFLGVAHIHTPSFVQTVKKRDDVTAKYVYDADAARAVKVAADLGAQVADVDTILADDTITSVVICSETRHHLDLVTKAAAAKKDVFVEKPLAITEDEANKIQAAIEAAGVVFQTGFFMRSYSYNRFIKREIEAGNLGTITRMRYTNCHQGALAGWFDKEWNWFTKKEEAGGGGFADMGAHALDIVLWCLSKTCGPVVKSSATIGDATHRYGDIDEWGAALITFQSGAVGIVEAGWVDPKYSAPIEVHGTEGQILVHDGKVFYFSKHVEGADGSEWTDVPASAPHAFDLFWEKLADKEAALVPIAEAAQESAVMYHLYRDAEKK